MAGRGVGTPACGPHAWSLPPARLPARAVPPSTSRPLRLHPQVIDDSAGHTLAATSTLNPEIRQALNGAGANVEAAKLVGAKIAELCKQKNIEKVRGVAVFCCWGQGRAGQRAMRTASSHPWQQPTAGSRPGPRLPTPALPAPTRVPQVCFDRGGFRYHGRVQALADAAREAGLNF